jgi:pimeloyl-ACP methyl ester carboxylesterase
MASEAERFVQVPGGKCFIKSWTPASPVCPEPIILLHDSLGCVGLWRDFPAKLAKRTSRVVIAYDRLGFGKSSPRDKVPSPHFIREEAEIYFPKIREAMQLERFALLGFSVGGGMAIHIAAQRDSGCMALVTESAQAYLEDLTLQTIREAEVNFRDPQQLARLQKWHGDKATWVLQAWTEVWQLPEVRDWTLAEILPEVHCPALAIHGDQDDFGSFAFPRMIADLVSGPSELLLLENCGHMPHREHEEPVIEAIDGFLRRAFV